MADRLRIDTNDCLLFAFIRVHSRLHFWFDPLGLVNIS
jgi:hypothetical protein